MEQLTRPTIPCAAMADRLLDLSTRTVGDAAIAWSEEEEAWRRGEITRVRLADGTEITEAPDPAGNSITVLEAADDGHRGHAGGEQAVPRPL